MKTTAQIRVPLDDLQALFGFPPADPFAQTATAQALGVKVPIVVRLEGTNADVAAKMLNKSGLQFLVAKDLTDAAQKAVKAVTNV